MLPSRTRLLVGTGLVLATVAATLAADGGREGEGDGGTRAEARTVSGTITAVAWPEAKLTVDASDGPVTLRIDRNTAVFLDDRLGSTRDLVVGTPVRASFGDDRRAAWIEVRARAPASTARDGGLASTGGGVADAGTATGPPVLPPPVGATVDAGTADAGAQALPAPDAGPSAPPSGNVPAGPSPPEPNPGATPPRPPPPPGPSGPGPVPIGPER